MDEETVAAIIEEAHDAGDGAIKQMKNRNYLQALRGYGGDILRVGINYDVKSKKHT